MRTRDRNKHDTRAVNRQQTKGATDIISARYDLDVVPAVSVRGSIAGLNKQNIQRIFNFQVSNCKDDEGGPPSRASQEAGRASATQ